MRIEELVSDWELEEIRQELVHGDAPDVVAFRHGIPRLSVIDYDIEVANRWSDAEEAFVRDNYPNHGKEWDGWRIVGKTYEAIERHAVRRGIRKRHVRWTREEDDAIRRHYPEKGARWDGWKALLPFRAESSDVIARRASSMGVRYEREERQDRNVD